MDALTLLHDDHERVRELFAQFEDEPDRRTDIAEQACAALSAHTQIEEELFYPAVQHQVGDASQVEEARVEHDSVKQLVSKLQSGLLDDAARDATFRVMARMVERHIEREEKNLFAEVRRSGLDLTELGEKMRAQHDDLMRHPVLTQGQHSTARRSHEPVS